MNLNSTRYIAYIICSIYWLLPVTHSISNAHATKVVDVILFEKWTPCTSLWLFRMIIPYRSGPRYCYNFFLSAYYRSSTCIYAGQFINWLSSNNIKSHIIGYIKHSPLCSRAGGNLNEFVQIITRSFNPELIWTYYNKIQ